MVTVVHTRCITVNIRKQKNISGSSYGLCFFNLPLKVNDWARRCGFMIEFEAHNRFFLERLRTCLMVGAVNVTTIQRSSLLMKTLLFYMFLAYR